MNLILQTALNSMIEKLLDFFNNPFFTIFGGFSTILVGLAVLLRALLWILGVTPPLIRLGVGLSQRKIAIIADDNKQTELKDLLSNSRLFRRSNLITIRSNNIESAKHCTIYVVDWDSFSTNIHDVIRTRLSDQVPIIILAKPRAIPHETMNSISDKPNIIVTNSKGRLVNDVISGIISSRP